MRFQGQQIGYIAGSYPDGRTLIYRLPHADLSTAPRLGDLVMIHDELTGNRWVGRVENQSHVSIELHEQEVRNAIARGQTSLGSELSEHEKEMYLGHDYAFKLLGEVRNNTVFAPVVRTLPPRGSSVKHLSVVELKQLVTLDNNGATIGYYAVGDEIFDTNSNQIPIKFSAKRFVSRRTAIFGVAGFGKSNLMKNILAELTVSEPTVGKLIFDLDGEYSFGSDDGKRVALADIPMVADRLMVYTNAKRVDAKYKDIICGEPVLNLGELSPRKVVSTLLPDSRQDKIYAELIKGLNNNKWREVLKLVSKDMYETDPQTVATVLGIRLDDNIASINGMIRALVPMVRGHSATSTLMQDVRENLKLGATIVIDLSSMSVEAAYNLTSFIVDELFERNQEIFVAGEAPPEVIVFIEEAQNVLAEKQVREGNPIARLAKEGRKYNLGMVYVSQQPGAIAKEVLTQTNTFFVLHLLSKIDLKALQEINPHYEGVIGDFVQMESLPGHAYIYSTVPEMPTQSYVFATKATSFTKTVEELKLRQPSAANILKKERAEAIEKVAQVIKELLHNTSPQSTNNDGEDCYRGGPISGQLVKKLAPKYAALVRSARNPEYAEPYWIVEGCRKLGYEARYELELGKSFLYVKVSNPITPIARPNGRASTALEDTDEDLPF